jgi:hypothetical protein
MPPCMELKRDRADPPIILPGHLTDEHVIKSLVTGLHR